MPVHLAENDPWPTTNALRNVINSLSIRTVSYFIEIKSSKNLRGNGIWGGVKKYEK